MNPIVILVVFLGLLSLVNTAQISWISSGGGDFSTGSNWGGGSSPGTSDVAIINAPGQTIQVTNPFTVTNLTILGGVLDIFTSSMITISDTLTLNGTTTSIRAEQSVPISVGSLSWGQSILSGNAVMNVSSTLTLFGTFTGTLSREISQGFVLNANGASSFWNSGSLTIGTSSILNIVGCIYVQHDSTSPSSGYNLYQVGSPLGRLVLYGCMVVNNYNSSVATTFNSPFSQQGSIVVQQGVMNLAGGSNMSSTIVVQSAGTLAFTSGPNYFLQGSSLTTFVNSTVQFGPVGNTYVQNSPFAISGSVIISSRVEMYSGSTTYNFAGGLYVVAGGSLIQDGATDSITIGSLSIAGGGNATFNAYIQVSNSLLLLAGNLASNNKLDFNGATNVINGTGILSGPGVVSFNNYPLQLSSGGTLAMPGGSVVINAGCTIFGSAVYLSQLTLLNIVSGTLSISSSLAGSGSSTLKISSQSTLQLNSFASLDGPSWTLNNLGTINVKGSSSISATFSNSGTVNISNGTLTIAGSLTSYSNFIISSSSVLSFSLGSNIATFSSGSSVVSNGGNVSCISGFISLGGTVNIATGVLLVSGATVDIVASASVTSLGSSVSITSGSLILDTLSTSPIPVTTVSGGNLTINTAATITNAFRLVSGSVIVNALVSFPSSLRLDGGTMFVNYRMNILASLTMSTSSSLGGTGLVSLSGNFYWNGGNLGTASDGSGCTMISSGSIFANGTVSISNNFTLISYSVVQVTGTITGSSLAVIKNSANSTMTFASGSVLAGGSSWYLYNYGTLSNADTSGGIVTLNAFLYNYGSVTFASGTVLMLAGGGIGSGVITSSGSLYFSGGTHTLQPGSSVLGTNGNFSFTGGSVSISGTVNLSAGSAFVVNGGNVTFTSASSILSLGQNLTVLSGNLVSSSPGMILPDVYMSGGTFFITTSVAFSGTLRMTKGTLNVADITSIASSIYLSGGSFQGAGTITAQGSLFWSGGELAGSGQSLTALGGLTINGTSMTLTNRRLLCAQFTSSTWISGDILGQSGGSFFIDSGAALNLSPGGNFISVDGTATTIGIVGTLIKNSTSVPFVSISAFLDISELGSLVVSPGNSISLEGGCRVLGSVQVASSGNITFGAGTHSFNSGSSLTVNGIFSTGSLLGSRNQSSLVQFNSNSTISLLTSSYINGTVNFITGCNVANLGTLWNVTSNGKVNFYSTSVSLPTLDVSGSITGTSNLTVSTSFVLRSGACTWSQGVVTSLAAFSVLSGTHSFASDIYATQGLTVSGGTLGGSANVYVSQSLYWQAGTISSALPSNQLVMLAGSTLYLQSSGTKELNTRTLFFSSTSNALWTGGYLIGSYGSYIINSVLATFTVNLDPFQIPTKVAACNSTTCLLSGGGNLLTFVNNGTLIKTDNTSSTPRTIEFQCIFQNNPVGSVNVLLGGVSFTNGSSYSNGTINFGSSTNVTLGGTFLLGDGNIFSGSGIAVLSGNVSITGNFNVSGSTNNAGSITFLDSTSIGELDLTR